MTAHYFKSRNKQIVVISQDARPVGIEFVVSNKAEARRIAKEHGAQAWNF